MKRTIFNSLNAMDRKKTYRFIGPESETQPDMALSIRELLEKHSRGLLHTPPAATYEPEIDIISLEKLDLSERHELAKRNVQLFAEDKERSEKDAQEKAAKKRQLDIEAEAQRMLEEKEKGTKGNQPPA